MLFKVILKQIGLIVVVMLIAILGASLLNYVTQFLTVCTPDKTLKNIITGQIYRGIYRNGVWVFNHVTEGIYQELYG